MRKSIAALACIAASLTISVDAFADAEQARIHFEAGKKLRDEDACERAIPEFDKSIAAEKSIGAYYNLGFCHERLGHRQEAFEAYRQAQQLASAKKDDRLREISGAVAALLETPHIRLVLPQPVPQGMQIRVDGELVHENVYQTETVIFTKPGKVHDVVVTAPGYQERRDSVETKQLRAIELRRPDDPRLPPPSTTTTEQGWTWQHWTGAGLIVVGLAGVTIVSAMLIAYKIEESNLYDKHASVCGLDGDSQCTRNESATKTDVYNEYQRNEQAAKDKAVAWIGGGIGGVLAIGGGIALIVVASSAKPTPPPLKAGDHAKASRPSFTIAPLFGNTQGGLAFQGTF